MIKRFLTVLTIMLCIAALAVPEILAGAMTLSVPEQQLDEYLIKNGYPSELVEILPYEIKLNSFTENATFDSVEYLTDGILSEGLNEGGPSTLAYIPNYQAWFMVENVSADRKSVV